MTVVEVVRTGDVEAGIDEVWAVLADFGAIGRWASGVDHSCLMSDRTAGVGTSRRIQVGRVALVERVVEWGPPSALAYAIEGLPPVLRSVVNRWTIEGGDDRARVTLTSMIDAGPRPPQRLVATAAGRRLGTASEQMLEGLDRYLSGRGSVTR